MERYVIHVTKECNAACDYCVSGDTKILMADYSEKEIKDVKIGDVVLGFDEIYTGERRKLIPSTVKNVFRRTADKIHNIKFYETDPGLNITGNHRILEYGNTWFTAETAKAEQYTTLKYDDNEFGHDHIHSITELFETVEVFNLETETGTYIANNVAVHNCYERDKTSTYTWNEIADTIYKIAEYNKHFNIEFLGGEPMMAFDFIVKTHDLLESFDKSKVQVDSYGITTNGLIVHDELIQFLKRSPKVHWSASMDGTPFMNSLRKDKNGINTHDKVLENFKLLAQEIGVNRLSIHMVIHPYNVGYLAEGIDHLYKNGVRSIGVGTIESTITIGKEYCDRYIKELDVVSKKICNDEYPGLYIDVLNSMKPRSDSRHYIKDENGKTLFESYGRAKGDIVDAINNNAATSPLGGLIEDIREIVYNAHQNRMKNWLR